MRHDLQCVGARGAATRAVTRYRAIPGRKSAWKLWLLLVVLFTSFYRLVAWL